MSRDSVMVQLSFAIARMYPGINIKEKALSSLSAYSMNHGIGKVIGWVENDVGLVFVPSWQFSWTSFLLSFRKGKR